MPKKRTSYWKGKKLPVKEAIRKLFEYRQWRCDVYTRDDFTCQECGERGGQLIAHHIKSFIEIIEEYKIQTIQEAVNCLELWNINNGLTLCKKCHKELHKKYIYDRPSK